MFLISINITESGLVAKPLDSKKVCKDLQLLFDDTIYGKSLNRGNTLLVDDLPMHKLNPHCLAA
ncbi:MAG: hypothetical protein EBW16_03675 [Burkholderiaceae bacterium]|nr:hypothetical protein [Burkholderiaceae bacterium]